MKRSTRNQMLTLMLLLISSFMETSVFAFNLADVNKLKTSKNCGNCDLSNADLSGLSLLGANVSGANMRNANLTNTVITNGILTNANLSGAIMGGARFNYSNMNQANLKVAILSATTDFTGAQMSGVIWINGKVCDFGAVGKGNKMPVKP